MFAFLARSAVRRAPFTLLIWVPLVALAVILGSPLASQLGGGLPDFMTPGSSSSKAAEQIEAASDADGNGGAFVLVQTPLGAAEYESKVKVNQVIQTVKALDDVVGVQTAYDGPGNPTMISTSGDSTYLIAQIDKDAHPEDVINDLREATEGIEGVQVGGPAATDVQVVETVREDLTRAELMAFPVLFVLALLIFRSAIAAALPVLMGGINVFLTMFLLRGVNEYIDISIFGLNLVSALGMGLAIDYSLLMVSRYRAELARLGDARAALHVAVEKTSHTIVFSAATVAASLAALCLFPQRFLYSMGLGGALVSLMAAVVSVIVLPAMLRVLGTKIDFLAPKRWQRALESHTDHDGWWYRLGTFVTGKPVATALTAAVLLLGMAAPVLDVKFTFMSAQDLPTSASARSIDDTLRADYDLQAQDSASVVIRSSDAATVNTIRDDLTALGGVDTVAPAVPLDDDTWLVNVIPDHGPLSAEALTLVEDIRAVDARGTQMEVGGLTAIYHDMRASLLDHLLWVVLLIAAGNMLLLTWLTRSIVLPIKSLIMNTLTVAATFGVLVVAFQWGWLAPAMGATAQGALDMTQPVLIFALVFGLSTDYGVMVLAAIKEARDNGAGERESVVIGVSRTGRIVTAAAILFCVALGALATSRLVFIKELGFGTAAGVIIDATLVRCLLVPSLMVLLGKFNWWGPTWLTGVRKHIGRHRAPTGAVARRLETEELLAKTRIARAGSGGGEAEAAHETSRDTAAHDGAPLPEAGEQAAADAADAAASDRRRGLRRRRSHSRDQRPVDAVGSASVESVEPVSPAESGVSAVSVEPAGPVGELFGEPDVSEPESSNGAVDEAEVDAADTAPAPTRRTRARAGAR